MSGSERFDRAALRLATSFLPKMRQLKPATGPPRVAQVSLCPARSGAYSLGSCRSSEGRSRQSGLDALPHNREGLRLPRVAQCGELIQRRRRRLDRMSFRRGQSTLFNGGHKRRGSCAKFSHRAACE